MSHPCPVPECARLVDDSKLACRNHWFTIPQPLRMAVLRAWRNGNGAGTVEHLHAISDAIDFLKGQKS